jgi:predicted AAA+ superfamily ATPase
MEALNRINPWWFYDNWENKDKHLSELSSQEYKWIPNWLDKVSLSPYSLNFIYGTRQTGKTTGIKLLISKMVKEQGIDPLSVFYLDLDYVASLQEFRNLIQGVIREKKKRGLPA